MFREKEKARMGVAQKNQYFPRYVAIALLACNGFWLASSQSGAQKSVRSCKNLAKKMEACKNIVGDKELASHYK